MSSVHYCIWVQGIQPPNYDIFSFMFFCLCYDDLEQNQVFKNVSKAFRLHLFDLKEIQ